MTYDFGTQTSPVAPGTTGVSESTLYSRPLGYGWASTVGLSSRDRSTADPLTRDFVFGSNNSFLVDVPNGTYDVTATIGDQDYSENNGSATVQGVALFTDLVTSAGQVVQRTARVAVTNGQLKVQFICGGGGCDYFVLDGLQIRSVGPTASAGGPYTGVVGTAVDLQGTASETGQTQFTYAWDFGDGTTGTGSNPSHVYRVTGSYVVTVEATDSDGLFGSATTTANIQYEGMPFTPSMVLNNFNGPTVPLNVSGETYPDQWVGWGPATISVNSSDAITGNSIQFNVTSGGLYAQFNPYDGIGRTFARDYSANPAAWQFNTYDRMSFWIKRPTSASPLETTGRGNANVGWYVKQITNAVYSSDEAGGNHYYNGLNLPNNGQWTHVILNMHPDHRRGDAGDVDPGNLPYPTATDGPDGGDDPPSTFNFFDTPTRFYIQENYQYPGIYLIDDIQFYQETATENDAQVYSLTSNYDPTMNEVIVTWEHHRDDLNINHEVRFSFSDIHQIGWAAATPAPNGILTPTGNAYNGMVYDTTALPLSGHSVVYIAIKPQNSNLFTQIAVPLDLP